MHTHMQGMHTHMPCTEPTTHEAAHEAAACNTQEEQVVVASLLTDNMGLLTDTAAHSQGQQQG
jgi:hypothetical protein